MFEDNSLEEGIRREGFLQGSITSGSCEAQLNIFRWKSRKDLLQYRILPVSARVHPELDVVIDGSEHFTR